MARTWPVTRKKQIALGAFDAVAGPIASLVSRDSKPLRTPAENILVLELWHMGDVVIATSVLRCLRIMYPDARLTLLAKEHARELLAHSELVDDIVTFDFPWTAMSSKYDPSRYDVRAMSSLVKKLKARDFDISLDCRMDLRSNLLTRSIGARRRVGYDFGGGSFLLTDRVPAPPASQHKVDDWRGLLAVLSDTAIVPSGIEPELTVLNSEKEEAARLLEASGIDTGRLIVGIHPGGSHDAKRWAPGNFAEVGRELSQRHDAQVVIFVDPDGYGSDMYVHGAVELRTSLREMMALLTQCDVLLCNDSGPMHIAAAVGTPVVAVFRTGDPEAYGPRGLGHFVVGNGAPWGKTTEVALEDVLDAAESAVAATA